ncbi:MAG: protein tonB [Pseudoxanthomonas sp.]|nr:protein tonB [Pseudoxanthomonas sp.]
MGVLLLAWAGFALAAGPASVRKQVEASMLVNGEIEVDAAGKVTRYEIDRREKLPEGVRKFVEDSIAGWQFAPTLLEGRPVAIRNRMGLLLVAKPIEGGDFRVELRGTSFYPISEAGYGLEVVHMDPPRYPQNAAQARVSGIVYLVLRIGPDGKVAEAVAEQVNLRVVAGEMQMKLWRGVLAKSATTRALLWSFRPPQNGELADDGSWSLRVPVAYSLQGDGDSYGRWIAYIPGPRQRAPWAEGDDVSPDTLADGGLYPVGGTGGLRLLSRAGG